MKTFIAAALALLVIGSAAHSEDPIPDRQTDLVEKRDGKWVIDRILLCQVRSGAFQSTQPSRQFQIEWCSEAPVRGAVSRDFFVYYSTLYWNQLQTRLLQQSGFVLNYPRPSLNCDPIEDPIGTPEFRARLFITSEGIQFDIANTATGEVTRNTSGW